MSDELHSWRLIPPTFGCTRRWECLKCGIHWVTSNVAPHDKSPDGSDDLECNTFIARTVMDG